MPDSPLIRIVLLVRQTLSTSLNTSSIGPLRPMMPAKPWLGNRLTEHVALVTDAARVDQLTHLQGDEIDVAERLLEEGRGAALARAPPLFRIAREVRRHHADDGVGRDASGRT